MCGRFTMTDPDDELVEAFGAVPGNDLPPVPNYNVCPTNRVAAVTSDDGTRRLRAMRWGFIPSWYKTLSDGPLIINARSETIAVKPAFREAVRARRCLIAASGFYEWSEGPDGARLPWTVQADVRVERRFALGAAALTAFVWAENVLGTRNTLAVYRATGRPDSDGFAATEVGQQTLAGPGAQAGYAAYVGGPVGVGGVQSTGAPFVYGQPRQVRVGVVLGL